MEGCIAPSEIPGVSSHESSVFGQLAERLIYADFRAKHPYPASDVFVDSYNPAAYLYFLVSHNPQFNEYIQRDFYTRLYDAGLMRVPDILVHSFAEQVFYEIKPDSSSGRAAGIEKVGVLSATYSHYKLPYTPGALYFGCDMIVASFAQQLTVKLKASLLDFGLIVYKLCVESRVTINLAILAALLRYVVKHMNEQSRNRTFRPIDLKPAFSYSELSGLARALGLTLAAGAAGIGWKFFWRAVARRFAARGAAAALLAGADGPLPIGDLIAVGLSIFTIIDIIRYSDAIWNEAAQIAGQEA